MDSIASLGNRLLLGLRIDKNDPAAVAFDDQSRHDLAVALWR